MSHRCASRDSPRTFPDRVRDNRLSCGFSLSPSPSSHPRSQAYSLCRSRREMHGRSCSRLHNSPGIQHGPLRRVRPQYYRQPFHQPATGSPNSDRKTASASSVSVFCCSVVAMSRSGGIRAQAMRTQDDARPRMHKPDGGGDVAQIERFRGQSLPEFPHELTFVLPRDLR